MSLSQDRDVLPIIVDSTMWLHRSYVMRRGDTVFGIDYGEELQVCWSLQIQTLLRKA